MRPLTLLLLAFPFALGAHAETYRERLLADEPVAYWRFDDMQECCTPNETHETLRANAGANVSLLEPGPRPPQFLLFPEENTAADFTHFQRDTFLRVQDPGPLSVFDFANGHTITIEAWVRPSKLAAGQDATIVTKGGTGNDRVAANNQNWSLLLRGFAAPAPVQKAAGAPAKPAVIASVSFVFRDEKNAGDSSWHRFTSAKGFLAEKEWHHVAATYTFGKPESARLWINGETIPVVWDLGGATTLGPVVDNDELWIGGAQGGRPESQFPGQIDELAIYRTPLSPERMKLHALREGAAPALVEVPVKTPSDARK